MEFNKNIQLDIISAFKQWIISIVHDELKFVKNQTTKSDTLLEINEWLTIEGACKFLKVSKPTLWGMTKRGIIAKYYLDGKPRYKLSDLDKLFLKISYGKELNND